MKKIVKKRKKVRFENLITKTFFFTMVLYLLTSVFLRSYNASLNVKLDQYDSTIVALSQENEMVQIEVNKLSKFERIMSITTSNGMTSYNDNVIVVNGND